MISPDPDWIVSVLRDPGDIRRLALPDWDLLIRQGRAGDLLGRVAARIDESGLADQVPEQPDAHLKAARIMVSSQHEEARREALLIVRALSLLDVPVIFLKGAGYVLGKVAASKGRLFTDIDILVPKARLGEVEGTLIADGWGTTHHDEYDQKYYRRWMHELPPMRHMIRQTVLDVHHSILPQTSRLRHDASRLIERAIAVPGMPGVRVLAPADMVLHSMTHLFHNEEFARGLRDLSDIDLMLRSFGTDATFWDRLVAGAEEQDLTRVLLLGLRHANRVLGTPVPPDCLARAVAAAGGGSRSVDFMFTRLLRSPHPGTAPSGTAAAASLAYLRAHWLRMPPFMLVRHLATKAWMRFRDAEPEMP